MLLTALLVGTIIYSSSHMRVMNNRGIKQTTKGHSANKTKRQAFNSVSVTIESIFYNHLNAYKERSRYKWKSRNWRKQEYIENQYLKIIFERKTHNNRIPPHLDSKEIPLATLWKNVCFSFT